MSYSRGTKKSGAIMEDQFQQLLVTITEGLNPFKPAATFARIPGQDRIGNFIYYSTATGIKLWQEATQSLPIKFNGTGGEVIQFIEELK